MVFSTKIAGLACASAKVNSRHKIEQAFRAGVTRAKNNFNNETLFMRIFVQLNWLVRRACKEVSFFLMKRSQENFYRCFNTVRQPATPPLLKIARLLVLTFLAVSCAARKPPPPPPVYPPTSESGVRQLRYLPSTPYDRLDTTTIEAESGTQYMSALQNARQAAARQGGNAMILVEDTEFRKKIKGRQSLVRRTIFWVVHLK